MNSAHASTSAIAVASRLMSVSFRVRDTLRRNCRMWIGLRGARSSFLVEPGELQQLGAHLQIRALRRRRVDLEPQLVVFGEKADDAAGLYERVGVGDRQNRRCV